jgi:hypothetical protein
VTITYCTSTGQVVTRNVLVSAGTRNTINVNTNAGSGLDLSAGISSSVPILVERPMYFNYQGVWTGGHDVVGFVPKQ